MVSWRCVCRIFRELMTAKEIQKHLRVYFSHAKYVVDNVYVFGDKYKETDVLIINQNGFCGDYEIKISKQDYKAEFKNKSLKHEILEKGHYTCKGNSSYVKIKGKWKPSKPGDKIQCERPNKFWFIVPENLISIEDIPKYAGLMYMSESGKIKIIKQAPFLHKEKLELETRLCRKFYYSYLELKNK